MRQSKNIITMALIAGLFLIPGICFALDSPAIYDPTKFLQSSDVSLQLLSKIFGMIPGISQFAASKKTIISTLFYAFNWGLFGCSGIFLCYTTIKIIAETSLEGGQMKGNVTAMWTVLRVICGVGLLIPNNTGYSTVNTLVMWVVIQSISLANWTWYNVSAGFGNNLGVSSGTMSGGTGVDSEKVNKDVNELITSDTDPTKIGTADVLRSLVCAEAVKLALSNISKNPNIDNASLNGGFKTYNCDPASGKCVMPFLNVPQDKLTSNNLFEQLFPNYNIKERKNRTPITSPINNFNASQLNGICGSFTVSADSTLNTGQSDKAKREAAIAKQKEEVSTGIENLQKMIGSLSGEATRLLGAATSTNKSTLDAIDPFKYRIATKGGEPIMLATPNTDPAMLPNKSKYVTDYSVNQNQLFADDPAVSSIKNELSSLNIPPTSQALLSAAASYYQSNTAIRTNEQINKTTQIESQTKEQIGLGWAVAGSYYRFISKQIEEQTSSRQACNIIDARLQPGEVAKSRESYPANSLFTMKNDVKSNDNVAYLLKSIDEAALGSSLKNTADSNSNVYLMRVMPLIYFASDYAKILKFNLASSSAADYANSADLNKAATAIETNAVEKIKLTPEQRINSTFNYTGLMALQVSATVLLCIPLVGGTAIAILAWLPGKFMNFRLDNIMQAWNDIMNNKPNMKIEINNNSIQAYDPISKLQLLGHVMVDQSLSYFTDMKALLISIGVAYGVSSAITAGMSTVASVGSFMGMLTGVTILGGVLNSINSTLESVTRSLVNGDMTMGMAIFLPVLVTGLTLTVYIPLIPYMLFLFGVISWLISVVCLMFAAPIICFLMLWSGASQENPLLSKEAEAFVMQLLAAFVRPTLMIAGLVAGIILATVSIDLLNYGFSAIMTNSVLGKASAAFKDTGLTDIKKIESLGGIVVYTFIMISVVNMCFSTIHSLYTEVMRIVGIQVGQAGGEAEKYMQEVKTGAETFGSAAGAGAKAGAETGKDIKAAGHKTSKEEREQTEASRQVSADKKEAKSRKGAEGDGGGTKQGPLRPNGKL